MYAAEGGAKDVIQALGRILRIVTVSQILSIELFALMKLGFA